jgi:hypothetical protein
MEGKRASIIAQRIGCHYHQPIQEVAEKGCAPFAANQRVLSVPAPQLALADTPPAYGAVLSFLADTQFSKGFAVMEPQRQAPSSLLIEQGCLSNAPTQ